MPICAIAFCSRKERDWPPALIARMRLCGEVFANALARKIADEQLQTTREQLAQMVRVSTAGHLAPSIAHELNQPLCAIIGNAHAATELLSAKSPDVQEIRAALQDVINDAKRAGEVVQRTHAMLKRHSIDHTLQDLKQLAQGAITLTGSYAMIRHIQVDSSIESVAPVLGHAVQIHQVITNLLVNAMDSIATDQSTPGRVVLSLRSDEATGRALLSVHDNGIGIKPEAAERIFEPYFTTKPTGLGMGLSIARAIVDAHGGTLWMEPNADRGVTFFMSLPVQRQGDPS
jgi:signal transduction histidine kinase